MTVIVRCSLLFVLMLNLLSCNEPDMVINQYYEKLGLNRLAAPKTQLEPGSLLLSTEKGVIYADQIYDYIEGNSEADFDVLASGGVAEFQAVLQEYAEDRSLSPTATLTFLDSILPMKVTGDVKFTANTKIDLTNASVKRIKVPSLLKFINSNKSEDFRNAVWDFSENKEIDAIYITYETYRSKQIIISSSDGNDIMAGAEVNKPFKVISEGGVKVKFVKTSKTNLLINSSSPYVFAVRTAKVDLGENHGEVKLDITNFVKPKEWGIMSAGTDDKYSSPISEDYKVPVEMIDNYMF